MEEIKKELIRRVTNLLSVKSLTTLIFTMTFSYMTIKGSDVSEQFASIMLMIIGFYYGTQTVK